MKIFTIAGNGSDKNLIIRVLVVNQKHDILIVGTTGDIT